MSAELPASLRNAFGALGVAWKKRGWKAADFRSFLHEAGFSVPERSLRRWMATCDGRGFELSGNVHRGRVKSLSIEQERLLVGFVLEKNEESTDVHLSAVRDFVLDHLGVELSNECVRNYLRNAGFSSRVAARSNKGYIINNGQLCSIAAGWINQQREDGVLNSPRELLCSVDFTYTGHRTDRPRTFTLRGSAQPHTMMPISRFTNCVVTCVWADGVNRTPPKLFTYNQEFRLDRGRTQRRDDQCAHLENCLSSCGLSNDQIVYVGTGERERRVFVSESAELLRRFFSEFDIPDGCIVLSDNGNAFREHGADVLLAIGFNKHAYYPAPIHQYLSPNDNHLHGVAKQKWRQLAVDFSDDVSASCSLLNLLSESISAVPAWFDANMQLGSKITDHGAIEKLITGSTAEDLKFHRQCIREYRTFRYGDARGGIPEAPPGLESSLDGEYWEKKKK